MNIIFDGESIFLNSLVSSTIAIRSCINDYVNIRLDNISYKLDYRPLDFNPNTIVPLKSAVYVIDCSKRIINQALYQNDLDQQRC